MVKAFKTNVSALGTWITNAQQQPLQLDAIYITSPDQKVTEENGSVAAGVVHEFKNYSIPLS